MFGWFKKDDGFEWHDYVRTTILVRRNARREKVSDVRKAAIDGVADVGRRGVNAGASGVNAAGRGITAMAGSVAKVAMQWAMIAGRWIAKMSRRGWRDGSAAVRKGAGIAAERGGQAASRGRVIAREGFKKVAAGSGAAWRAGKHHGSKLGGKLGDKLGDAVGRAAPLERARDWFGGFSRYRGPASGLLRTVGDVFGRAADTVRDYAGSFRPSGGAVAVVGGVIAIAAGIYWWGGPSLSVLDSASPVASIGGGGIVSGKAKSLSGDTMRVDGLTIKLAGIEAPLPEQRCSRAGGRIWRCGRSALTALRRVTGNHRVTCELNRATAAAAGGGEVAGTHVGVCRIGDMDIGAMMVLEGHVFAQQGYFSAYGSQESEARSAKLGIWRGDIVRPKAYRAQRWKTAAKKAPNGCPVKGRVSSSRGKIYVMPWAKKYSRISIKARRGERWFCSEQEALDAGWKPSRSL